MFTGIIEEIGTVKAINKKNNSCELIIQAKKIMEDLAIGDSVATNGVCLTVTKINGSEYHADVMNETLSRSNLGELSSLSKVNLERAMPANGRFGGHIVSGHIDGCGIITEIKQDGNAIWYTVHTTENLMKYIVRKGSIAIDGISLTVAKVTKETFSVSIIPHTAKETILFYKQKGDVVNLENDIVGKYIEKFLEIKQEVKTSNITREFLLKNGF